MLEEAGDEGPPDHVVVTPARLAGQAQLLHVALQLLKDVLRLAEGADVDEVVAAPLPLVLPRHLQVGPQHVEQGQVVAVPARELESGRVGLLLLLPESKESR